MPVSEATYKRLSLEDDENKWELVCGQLRKKPPMTHEHADTAFELAFRLRLQLDPGHYRVHIDNSRAEFGDQNYFVPDIAVVPYELFAPYRRVDDQLESFSDPLPLVIEVWSRSTGEYDVLTKLPEYQRRGDAVISLVNPYVPNLTDWTKQADGSYASEVHAGGTVEIASLPGVKVDLDELFNRR